MYLSVYNSWKQQRKQQTSDRGMRLFKKLQELSNEPSDEDSEASPAWHDEPDMVLLILAPEVSPYDVAFRLAYPPQSPQPIVFGLERACNIHANPGSIH
jgi:hypothetical protein